MSAIVKTVTVDVAGKSDDEIIALERKLLLLTGVYSTKVNEGTLELSIAYNSDKIREEAILSRIHEASEPVS
ncbi:MAG: hypothetical protein HY731_05975 [Candidatus Tectomicrobia bacterium]|nr:hypothetical protein [Candidatus Tectomicrobia bacterium]